MKLNCQPQRPRHQSRFTNRSASSRPLVLALVCFALGAGVAGFWFYRQSAVAQGQVISEQTRSSLTALTAPVTIRFYSLLPASIADEKWAAFSERVSRLLDAVQKAGNGKIQVTTIQATDETNADAAANEGIYAFDMNRDGACYLGLTVSSGASKQTMPRLLPEWEPALQYDLARTILAVANTATPPVRPEVAKPSAEIVASIHRLIPDVSSVSMDQASQIFHEEFMKECKAAGTEMEAKIQAAQQKILQAQADGSSEELASARDRLLEVQHQQTDRMKQIAADLQTRLAIFQQMKAASDSAK